MNCNELKSTCLALYFGIRVEVSRRLEHWSLIRYREREFLVDTGDLMILEHA